MADTPVDNVDDNATTADGTPEEKPTKKAAAKKAPAKKAAAKKTAAKKAPAKKAAAAPPDESGETPAAEPAKKAPAKKAAAKKAAAKKAPAKKAAAPKADVEPAAADADGTADPAAEEGGAGAAVLFQAPKVTKTTRKRSQPKPAPKVDEDEADEETEAAAPLAAEPAASGSTEPDASDDTEGDTEGETDGETEGEGGTGTAARRRRRRGGRRRRKPSGTGGDEASGEGDDDSDEDSAQDDGEAKGAAEAKKSDDKPGDKPGAKSGGKSGGRPEGKGDGDDSGEQGGGGSSSSRRRRQRRREGEAGSDAHDDPNTVTRVRKPRSAEDEITAVSGSTRLEAKKQRRREGREAGRRRAPIVSEAEFLARRESVERVMVVRQRKDVTQIGVIEDKVLVEHYVARESQTSLIGNVYLGRVQNVLPSMEAAFIDIGKGRNAVLYAGEVNWSALGHKEGSPRKIESVLQSGQPVLVQVTKDPIGHKGARLTSQVSLAGRFLVYVPDGTTSGISRKLPDTERGRLKTLLKEIVPESAGVIVRTAAEGASEDELTRDVERLKARWEDVEAKVAKGNAPQLLYGEPDLTLKVVRDLFTEDFSKLVVQGDEAWETVRDYVDHVAPDLADRLEHYENVVDGEHRPDVFATYRIDEQIAKGLDRKVWLPSGGSLVIDRTEAMTVVDVNTGKFTGSGGNLEETVTKNNLEAAEEIVRQLRLRDIGGIIVVDFIDMVLESNRDLVLRRLVECLGRDRTRHQVAEVTSLGLVQMTRKRIGTGLLEAFSETCDHCQGRGLIVHDLPVESRRGGNGGNGGGGNAGSGDEGGSRGSRRRRGKGGGNQADEPAKTVVPSPKDVAAMAKPPSDEDAVPLDEDAVSADESAVSLDEVAVSLDESAPLADEVAPEPDAAPSTEDSAPSTEESAPSTEDSVPPTEESVPSTEDSAPSADAMPEPAAPPKVVTRTRRRAATRPAGPPVTAPTQDGPVDERPSEDGSADAVPEEPTGDASTDEPHVEHVPIKRKGTRKR
ncbi:Rne/Rng family ribonuclease [Nocardioides sp. MH1]|uniref:Rne/Rng family ribonuclease n=1 Tax=Nocardioides sp. MH1 TaxID=3242490 RepID=UPI003521F122